MKIDLNVAGSRPAGVAEELLGKPVSAESIYAQHVILTGEPEVLATPNGRWIFEDALRLLQCVAGRLTVVVPPQFDDLAQLASRIASSAWSNKQPVIVNDLSAVAGADLAVTLNVGNKVLDPSTWTAVNSNGWIAHVSSQGNLHTRVFDQANPVAALMAASLGVAEVFKRLVRISDELAPPLEPTSLSLFDYSTSGRTLGPKLRDELWLPDTVLVGAGAIGNGIALLLAQLRIRGHLRIIDKQDYGEENFGTSLLLEREGWIGPKAEKLAAWLERNSALAVRGKKILIEEAIASGFFAASPALVLNALDDVPARRKVQDLWPRVLIDGGINSVGASVIQYHLTRAQCGCIRCWFHEAPKDHREYQSKLTGLSLEAVTNINRPITDADIANAKPEHRDLLIKGQREGKMLCATMPDMEARLGVKAEGTFRPSVPFVATASAALVISEALKAIAFKEGKSPGMFQMGNLFLGPEASAALEQAPLANCRCVLQRQLIEQIYLKPEPV